MEWHLSQRLTQASECRTSLIVFVDNGLAQDLHLPATAQAEICLFCSLDVFCSFARAKLALAVPARAPRAGVPALAFLVERTAALRRCTCHCASINGRGSCDGLAHAALLARACMMRRACPAALALPDPPSLDVFCSCARAGACSRRACSCTRARVHACMRACTYAGGAAPLRRRERRAEVPRGAA